MRTKSIFLATLLLIVAGCNAFRHGSDPAVQAGATTLEVDNQGFVDMTVYAVRNSQRLRLELATRNHKTTMTIPLGLIGGITTLRFIADPIGGTRASVSQEISVTPGDTVELLIPPL